MTDKLVKSYTGIAFRGVRVGHWSELEVDTNKRLMEGFIYILSNESMPGIYKIGMTTRDPEQRVKELSGSTSIPTSFKLEDAWHTSDMANIEQEIHQHLDYLRVNTQREFFKGDLAFLKEVVQDFCGFKRGEDYGEFHNKYNYTSSEILPKERVNVSISKDTFDSLSWSSHGDINMIIDGMVRMFTEKSSCNMHFSSDSVTVFETPFDEYVNSEYGRQSAYIVEITPTNKGVQNG
jgi:hypothetical protein